jgi:hypothetical protein
MINSATLMNGCLVHRRLWSRSKWRVLEHSGSVFDYLDAAVEGAAADHVEDDIGVAVVDAICSGGPCDHWEHSNPEPVDESGSE